MEQRDVDRLRADQGLRLPGGGRDVGDHSVDSAGPFREVTPAGLAPDTAYHHRIGAGADHVLRTAPIGSFRWVDVGDTAGSVCKPWMAQTHQLITQLQPRFVTHGGDIFEANVCGVPAVRSYHSDQQAWSMAARVPAPSAHRGAASGSSGSPLHRRPTAVGRDRTWDVCRGQCVPVLPSASLTVCAAGGPACRSGGTLVANGNSPSTGDQRQSVTGAISLGVRARRVVPPA
jgi:hypothetical protein